MDKAAWVWMVVAAVMVGGAARGQGGPVMGPGTQVAPGVGIGPGIDKARWQAIVTKLGSAAFAEREAGQKELEKAGTKDRETLKALAEGSKDAEVKARLLGRIRELDDQRAVEPALLAVHVDKVGLKEAMGELSRVTGLAFYEEPMQGGGVFPRRDLVSLEIAGSTFWEAMDQAMQQARVQIGLDETGGAVRWQDLGIANVSSRVAYGPGVAVSLLYVRRHHEVVFQAGPAGDRVEHSLGVMLLARGDPRIAARPGYAFDVTTVRDDKGHSLLPARAGGGKSAGTWPRHYAGDLLELELPSGVAEGELGKTLEIVGTFSWSADVGMERVTLPSVGGEGMSFLGMKVTMDKATLRDGRLEGEVSLEKGTVAEGLWAMLTAGAKAVEVQPFRVKATFEEGAADAGEVHCFLQRDGRVKLRFSAAARMEGMRVREYGALKSLELAWPLRVREVVTSFSFKDVPLP
jgi:hypothetical protein